MKRREFITLLGGERRRGRWRRARSRRRHQCRRSAGSPGDAASYGFLSRHFTMGCARSAILKDGTSPLSINGPKAIRPGFPSWRTNWSGRTSRSLWPEDRSVRRPLRSTFPFRS